MNFPRPGPTVRASAAAVLFLLPRVCVGDAASDDGASQAQGVTAGVHSSLQGVVGDLSNGQVAEIYGERSPDASASLPGATAAGTRATTNGPELPEAQLPQEFRAPAAAPPAVSAAAPSDILARIKSWLSTTAMDWVPGSIAAPPSAPVPDPSFSSMGDCSAGRTDCVKVMTIKENSPAGLRDVPITKFVDYGSVLYHGRVDNRVWDQPPWWKFWADPRQVNSDDIKQGGLGDCFLLASLAALAQNEPQVLREMVKLDLNTGSVWVQFFNGRPLKKVLLGPLDRLFPVYKPGVEIGTEAAGGQAIFAKPAGEQGATWPLIIEKAYALEFSKKSYAVLTGGGFPEDALTRIIGRPSQTYLFDQSFKPVQLPMSHYMSGRIPFSTIAAWSSDSEAMVVSTKSAPKNGCPADPAPGRSAAPSAVPPSPGVGYSVCDDPLYQGAVDCTPNSTDPVCADPSKIVKLEMSHAYWVKSVDADAQTVTIANPWGSKLPTITLPWARLEKSLTAITANK